MIYFTLPSVYSVGVFDGLALGRQPCDARGLVLLRGYSPRLPLYISTESPCFLLEPFLVAFDFPS